MNNEYHIEIYKELSINVQRHIVGDGIHQTTISPLSIIKSSTLTVPTHVLYQPAFCIILQGRKEAVLADEVLYYGVGDYLVASVDLPVKGQVIEASESEPYLCLRLDIDPYVLYEVLTASGLSLTNRNRIPRGLFVEKMDDGLIDSVTRLIKLLDKPNDISVLADLLIREIYYRLLSGPQGHAVSNAALIGTKMQRISQAIQHIKQEFNKPVRIMTLCEIAGMSAASFHQHFKDVTAMSPLQYQKNLKLLEARRLMVIDRVDAANAAFQVGYESPSQFSREYSRMFGAPPMSDVKRLWNDTADVNSYS